MKGSLFCLSQRGEMRLPQISLRAICSACLIAAFLMCIFVRLPAGAEQAPVRYRVAFTTSKGVFVVRVERRQAPNGADRLYELVKANFFDGARFYRVVPGFVVQWGYPANPSLNAKWSAMLPDDPVRGTNRRGTLTFAATNSPNSRSTQLFINYADNARLDSLGFAPVGEVITGMPVVDRVYSGYGETPDQGELAQRGNAYAQAQFPKLDYIISTRIISPAGK